MAHATAAIGYVLGHEGGYVFDPHDPGGETLYGISAAAYPDLDIKRLTKADAVAIYERDYWTQNRLGEIHHQLVATYVPDMCVNMGASRGVKIAQRAANYYGALLERDGHMGDLTISALAGQPANRLVYTMVALRGSYYEELVTIRPNLRRFAWGWMRRTFAILELEE